MVLMASLKPCQENCRNWILIAQTLGFCYIIISLSLTAQCWFTSYGSRWRGQAIKVMVKIMQFAIDIDKHLKCVPQRGLFCPSATLALQLDWNTVYRLSDLKNPWARCHFSDIVLYDTHVCKMKVGTVHTTPKSRFCSIHSWPSLNSSCRPIM